MNTHIIYVYTYMYINVYMCIRIEIESNYFNTLGFRILTTTQSAETVLLSTTLVHFSYFLHFLYINMYNLCNLLIYAPPSLAYDLFLDQ